MKRFYGENFCGRKPRETGDHRGQFPPGTGYVDGMMIDGVPHVRHMGVFVYGVHIAIAVTPRSEFAANG